MYGTPILSLALSASGFSAPFGGEGRDNIGYELAVPSVQVHPVVRHRGHYVNGLTPDDFVILDDGVPALLESFTTGSPLNIAIMLDGSTSMIPDLPRVTAAALQFLHHLAPTDRASGFVFHGGALHAVGPTDQFEEVRDALELSPRGGSTLLFDAISVALGHFIRVGERNVLVLFSDGLDSGSRATEAEALRRAVDSGVVIYTLSVASGRLELSTRRTLIRLAHETGGESHFLPSSRKLDQVFDEILSDLRAQYTLSFTPRAGPPGERKIEVDTVDERYQVRSRRSYRAE